MVGAATYYVRTNGDNDLCSGLTNQAVGVDNPNCAFLTPQKAMSVFNCNTPDTVNITAGTYSGQIAIPDPCVGRGYASMATISGPGDDSAVLSGADGILTTIYLHNISTSTSGRNKFLKITGLKILCSDDKCIGWDGTWEGVEIDGNTFVHDGGGSSTCETGNHGGMVLGTIDNLSTAWGFIVTDNIATGTEGLTRAGLTGSDVCFMRYNKNNEPCASCAIADGGAYIARNTVTGLLAAFFDGRATNSVIEGNRVTTSNCIGDENSCIQLYNSPRVIVRDNLFENIKTGGSIGGRAIGFRTTAGQPDETVSAWIVNNTFVGSTVDNSSTNSRAAIHFDGSIDPDSARSYINNNLVMRNWGTGGTTIYPIGFGGCPTAGIDVSNNVFDDNRWPDAGGTTPDDAAWHGNIPSCSSLFDPDSQVNFGNSPASLETTNWTPNVDGATPCRLGTTAILMPAQAGQAAKYSKSWAGYAKGSCTFCGDGTRNGQEECDKESLGWSGCDTIPPPYGWCTSGTPLACNANCTYNISACTDCGNFYPFSCRNGQVDAPETDVDCGGGTCAPCALGKKCLNNSTPYVNLASSDCEQGKGPGGRLRNRRTIYCHQIDCATGDFICTNSSCPEEP